MKKQLLNESEVRKLMKFANLAALSENFVQNLEEEDETLSEEETVPEEEDLMEQPLDEQDPEPEPLEAPDEDEVPEDDMAMDLGAEEDASDGVTAEVTIGDEEASALMGVLQQLEDAMGEDEGEEMPEEMPEEVPEEMPEEELEESGIKLYEDDDIVNEVTRRVAQRLLAAKRQQH